MMGYFWRIVLVFFLFLGKNQQYSTLAAQAPLLPLQWEKLPDSWDEGLPLGNGMLGALIWQKDQQLRLALDRADLWDLRPMANLDRPEWRFDWVKAQWEKNEYEIVQELFDLPYERDPAPSKLPAGALEFDIRPLGNVERVQLDLQEATARIYWENNTVFSCFVDQNQQMGWFQFTGLSIDLQPVFKAPPYSKEKQSAEVNAVEGQDLQRLGYPAGTWEKGAQSIRFRQQGWGNFQYEVQVVWKREADRLSGCWSIHTLEPVPLPEPTALATVFETAKQQHIESWKDFWNRSWIALPNDTLQHQWQLEMYKLGAATGNGAPPISLQAIWTADNGRLPPWKGDFHNDLNVQMSYWPSYSANHLDRSMGLIDWLESNKPAFESYTRQFYQLPGLNVPGVSTLDGQPMGGWIQYAFGPTVSAWLGHHYYLQWRYAMDTVFLSEKAYPWISETACFLEALSTKDAKGKRSLPLSSSPEIRDNSRDAWFSSTTNFDLGLIRWTFAKAAELALVLDKKAESKKWMQVLSEWPDFDVAENGLTFAPQTPYQSSHRHFSHLVAWHPLGVLDVSKGKTEQRLLQNTLDNLYRHGPSAWCGYSYSWLGNLCARNKDGKRAEQALSIFAQHFCLKNSFHVNGDQSGLGFSNYTYRPFTLEGNFAFAAGLQEMLLQSHAGWVEVFPAIPDRWKEVRFHQLRAEGAFLVSARYNDNQVQSIEVTSEKGGMLRLKLPPGWEKIKCDQPHRMKNGLVEIQTEKNQKITLTAD